MTDRHNDDFVVNGDGNQRSLDDVLDLVDRTRSLIRMMGAVVTALLLATAGLVWQVTQRNRAFNDVKEDIVVIRDVAEGVQKAQSDNSDSDAVGTGLQRINEILQILCDERPDHVQCEGG